MLEATKHPIAVLFLAVLINWPGSVLEAKYRFVEDYVRQYFVASCDPNALEDPCADDFDYMSGRVEGYLQSKARAEYQARYGHLKASPVKGDNLAEYAKRAEEGDLAAILELRRYYENPDNPGFDPELVRARQYLLRAVKAGSVEAMYELGYEAPYIAATETAAGDIPVGLYAACDGLHSEGGRQYPGCFLYILSIGRADQFGEERKNLVPKRFYVINREYLNEAPAMVPTALAIVSSEEEPLIELSSSDASNQSRKDYFTLGGDYLGSDREKAPMNYFWNSSKAGPLTGGLKARLKNKPKYAVKLEVQTRPSYEAFEIREEVRSQSPGAVQEILAGHRRIDFSPKLANLDEEVKAVKRYYFKYGRHPAVSLNPIRPYTLSRYANERLVPKDIVSKRLLVEYFSNPLNDAYDLNVAETVSWQQPENYQDQFDDDPSGLIDTYYNPVQAPYITKTSAFIGDLEIQAYLICQGCAPGSKENNNCFAKFLSFETGGRSKNHFIVPSRSDYKVPDIFFSLDLTRTPDGLRRLTFEEHANKWARKDFFNLQGDYLGSYNADDSTSIVTGYKPLRIPILFDDTNGELTIHPSITPSWEDRQIIKVRVW